MYEDASGAVCPPYDPGLADTTIMGTAAQDTAWAAWEGAVAYVTSLPERFRVVNLRDVAEMLP